MFKLHIYSIEIEYPASLSTYNLICLEVSYIHFLEMRSISINSVLLS